MANNRLLEYLEDLSKSYGENIGFQFRMKCSSCNRFALTSEFIPFSHASTFSFTKLFKKDPNQVTITQSPEWQAEHAKVAEAFANAIEDKFVFCSKCDKFVCQKCWNTARDMCVSCCARYAMSAYDAYYEAIQAKVQKCLNCGTDVTGVKFCPKCGTKVTPKGVCPKCSSKVPEDAIFCTECGTKLK